MMCVKKEANDAEDDMFEADLGEFSDEDDYDGDATQLNSKEFELPDCLPQVHWHRRTVADIVDMLNGPYCDLNPDYQRDFVWSSDRMIRLINSIMTDFYVPPVIFNVLKKTDPNDGSTVYHRISVDGKQRLTSIKHFVDGKVPCTDKYNRRWFFIDDGDQTGSIKRKRVLPMKIKRMFLKKELLTAEFAALDRRQEEDLFSRVQLGMPLTPAEKLKASSGHWQTFAIQIETKFPELLNTFDNKRGRGFQLVLQILKQLCSADDVTPTYTPSVSSLKTFCSKPVDILNRIKADAGRVFKKYDELNKKFPETFTAKATYKHSLKFSPVEFVGIGVLIHRFPNRNARLLSGDILHMREFLREKRQDLRSNTATWRTIMEFIENIEIYRGGLNTVPNNQMDIENGEGNSNDEPGSESDDIFTVTTGDISRQDASGNSSNTLIGTNKNTKSRNAQQQRQEQELLDEVRQQKTSNALSPPRPLQPQTPASGSGPPQPEVVGGRTIFNRSSKAQTITNGSSDSPSVSQKPPATISELRRRWENIERMASVKRERLETPQPDLRTPTPTQTRTEIRAPTQSDDDDGTLSPRTTLKRRWEDISRRASVKRERLDSPSLP